MPETVNALVIRESVTGESTKVLTLLTERGILRAFANGVRKPGSPLTAPCSLFAYSRLMLAEGKGRGGAPGQTCSVRSGEVLSLFRGIFADVEKLVLAGFFAELAQTVLPDNTDSSQQLKLFLNALHLLSLGKHPNDQIEAVFLWKMLELAGYMPNILGCQVCGAYESPDMCLDIARQCLCCAQHLDGDDRVHGSYAVPDDRVHGSYAVPDDRVHLPAAALTALRHILLSEPARQFAFRVPEESLTALCTAGERSAAYLFERNFSTLRFYRQMQTR